MTYDVYEPGTDGPGSGGPWRVALEYSNQGERKPPTLVQIGRTEHADRATALEAAIAAAREFSPPDPWSEQSRAIYRDGPDGFLVILEGATSTFHMSVRIIAAVPREAQ
ncbi:hypothetical protein FHP29_04950 [Nocardioides albidus]|uniref:Uncharacterized protein n=1 Tax=Nocardioides albidus TaxID=1517589 RepID=A0A5C4WC54_9ACTN|nr:hypothetical protein [Nocardioides albidus]TNM45156.1 hypothetical protein FHP29_04950 [Nocardioides albidus]